MWVSVIGWALVGCATPSLVRQAEVFDACDDPSVDGPEVCVPCASDGECVLAGNACQETVACMHGDAEVSFASIGCDRVLEHPWPDEADCECAADGLCGWGGE